MIVLAILSTLVAGFVESFAEPSALGASLPVAVMGTFLLRTVSHSGKVTAPRDNTGNFSVREPCLLLRRRALSFL